MIATCGNMGNFRLGGLLASLLAYPIIFGMKALYWIDPHLASIVTTVLIFISLVIVHIAVNTISEEDTSMIVIDRVVGLSLAFMYVPFTFKFILVGFIFFHLLYNLYPIIIENSLNLNVESLPSLLSVSSASILSGISVQLFFRLMMWIVH